MKFKYKDNMKKIGVFAAVLFSVLAGIFLSYWLAFFLLPFLIALILSSIMEPLIRLMNRKLHIRRKLAAPIVLLLLLAIVASLLTMLVLKIIDEIKALITIAPQFFTGLYAQLSEWMAMGSAYIEWLPPEITENLGSVISSISATITNFGKSIVSSAFTTAVSFPEVLIFTIITIMATYFMSSDRDRISSVFHRHLPESWIHRIVGIKKDMFSALFGYLRSAMILMTITFTELFIGFSIIGLGYPLLLAFLIAIIDALPVLGTGGVLIPWAVYSFITNDIRMGVSILILYIVVLVIRQIIEPKILGHQIGVYPLLTLASMYIGLHLIGFAGLILGPITYLLIRNILIAIYKNKPFKEIIGFGSEPKVDD